MPSDPPSTPRISKALTRRVYRCSKRWLPAAGGTYHFNIFTRQFESPCLIPPTQKSGSSCLVLHGCSEADPSHFNCPANGRFIRYAAVPRLTHLQQFSCCVRAQREFRIHRMGLLQDLRRYLLRCPVCRLTLSTMMNWRLPEKSIHCRHFRSASNRRSRFPASVPQ